MLSQVLPYTLAAFMLLSILTLSSVQAQTPGPTPTAQGTVGQGGTYVVVAGDTLYGIASRFDLTVAQITSLNNMGATPTLAVGQRLILPGQGSPRSPGGSDQVEPIAVGRGPARNYTVQPGDTLYSIARSQTVTVSDLAAANAITDPRQLSVGQSLVIPGKGLVPSNPTLRDPIVTTHEVQPGETLYAIARLYNLTVAALSQANGIGDPSQLRVGQALRLPAPQGAAIGVGGAGAPVVTLPNDQGEVFLDPVGPTPVSGPAASSDPAQTEVAVVTGPATPVMLPNPPPRRSSKFHWPARGRILTRFGRQSNGQTADGIEIQVDSEEPIVAADDGVVAFAGTGVSGYGYLVLIKHADDYFTAYGQNSAVNVARGDVVRQGQMIARAGNNLVGVNGRLHFEVRYREDPVNPIAHMVN